MKKVSSWDVFVSKSGYEAIVDFVTKHRIVMSVWQGTLKQPERLVFNIQEFHEGMNKMWTFKGNKFKVKASEVFERIRWTDYRNVWDVKYIEWFWGSNDKLASDAVPGDIINREWSSTFFMIRWVEMIDDRKYFISSDTTEYPNKFLNNHSIKAPATLRTADGMWNDYRVKEWLISLAKIAYEFGIDVNNIDVLDDTKEWAPTLATN